MGAWIEIYQFAQKVSDYLVAPHDGCVDWNIELSAITQKSSGRTPRWVRGLKFDCCNCCINRSVVAPHDGCVDWNLYVAWNCILSLSRTPRWVRGLKLDLSGVIESAQSRTPRWVRGLKLFKITSLEGISIVAPHDGCVDWNKQEGNDLVLVKDVAPHDGCVDWNTFCISTFVFCCSVAPHDGCVDWNMIGALTGKTEKESHPTMGAWIEIAVCWWPIKRESVAPHDGCVDWNKYDNSKPTSSYRCRTPRWVRGLKLQVYYIICNTYKSHPTMGAWIEIPSKSVLKVEIVVAPHDGCVDWNNQKQNRDDRKIKSHPTMGAWIEMNFCMSSFRKSAVAPHDGCVDWN